jgi:hypothetical protein
MLRRPFPFVGFATSLIVLRVATAIFRSFQRWWPNRMSA